MPAIRRCIGSVTNANILLENIVKAEFPDEEKTALFLDIAPQCSVSRFRWSREAVNLIRKLVNDARFSRLEPIHQKYFRLIADGMNSESAFDQTLDEL